MKIYKSTYEPTNLMFITHLPKYVSLHSEVISIEMREKILGHFLHTPIKILSQ